MNPFLVAGVDTERGYVSKENIKSLNVFGVANLGATPTFTLETDMPTLDIAGGGISGDAAKYVSLWSFYDVDTLPIDSYFGLTTETELTGQGVMAFQCDDQNYTWYANASPLTIPAGFFGGATVTGPETYFSNDGLLTMTCLISGTYVVALSAYANESTGTFSDAPTATGDALSAQMVGFTTVLGGSALRVFLVDAVVDDEIALDFNYSLPTGGYLDAAVRVFPVTDVVTAGDFFDTFGYGA